MRFMIAVEKKRITIFIHVLAQWNVFGYHSNKIVRRVKKKFSLSLDFHRNPSSWGFYLVLFSLLFRGCLLHTKCLQTLFWPTETYLQLQKNCNIIWIQRMSKMNFCTNLYRWKRKFRRDSWRNHAIPKSFYIKIKLKDLCSKTSTEKEGEKSVHINATLVHAMWLGLSPNHSKWVIFHWSKWMCRKINRFIQSVCLHTFRLLVIRWLPNCEWPTITCAATFKPMIRLSNDTMLVHNLTALL